MYVLRRTDQGGGYVAKPGSRTSYTSNVFRARTFSSEAEAIREKCDNEAVERFDTLHNPFRGITGD